MANEWPHACTSMPADSAPQLVSMEDVAAMHSLLPKYHEYVVEQHAYTLLPHYLGTATARTRTRTRLRTRLDTTSTSTAPAPRPPNPLVSSHSRVSSGARAGMYRVRVNDQKLYVLVMRHMFSPRLRVLAKYDLKVPASSHLIPLHSIPFHSVPFRSVPLPAAAPSALPPSLLTTRSLTLALHAHAHAHAHAERHHCGATRVEHFRRGTLPLPALLAHA